MSEFIIKNMIIGLTGGIGSGKSLAGDFFSELGIDVIDSDRIAREILDKNSEAKNLFLDKFGSEFLDKNQNINRELLRSEIFKDDKKKKKLESIVHPIVRQEIIKFINNSNSIYKIIMVPLIYETQSNHIYDKIIVIDCDENKQIDRATKRDNKSKEDIFNIIKNQASRSQRKSIANYVIENNSSKEELRSQVIKIHQKLLGIKIDE